MIPTVDYIQVNGDRALEQRFDAAKDIQAFVDVLEPLLPVQGAPAAGSVFFERGIAVESFVSVYPAFLLSIFV